MKIATLKDVKNALKDVPDEKLDDFGFNWHEEGEEVQLLSYNANDPEGSYSEVEDKYPQLLDINKWIKNIIKAGIKSYEQEQEDLDTMREAGEPISSEEDGESNSPSYINRKELMKSYLKKIIKGEQKFIFTEQ
jgi:hypothetical protein